MRLLVSLSLLMVLSFSGCGDPAPEPIEGPDDAVEMTDDQIEAEEELTEDNEGGDPDAI